MGTSRGILLVAVLALGCADADDPGPWIDALAADRARVGQEVNVLGSRFCGAQAAGGRCQVSGFVTFGTAEGIASGDAESWEDTRIVVTVPPLALGPTSVVVTVRGRQSNAVDFLVEE